ncbi:cytochrome P450 [Agromyces sp. SYSU K20354]|uniref:cytochrome P450 n=1 Tax=Agromyces cavernae TaxID=2898659 RepID=UPI001E307C2D|nr:cytochrome P450 [Agromyces cavernae]MCD2441892.1 cytochrome P450 [Agromyces cavernae]
MTEILDRADVARVLVDPRFTVPTADASATTPFDRFRALASRFANGPVHDARRERLAAMLAALDLTELGAIAAARTRRWVEASGGDPDLDAVARHVPVTALARSLGFRDADALPPFVESIADRYASGHAPDRVDGAEQPSDSAEDAAVDRLLTASGATGQEAALRVQLLVQAFAARPRSLAPFARDRRGRHRRAASTTAEHTATRALRAPEPNPPGGRPC